MRWLLVLFIAALGGCGPRPQSCRNADDCAAPQVCERFFCVAALPVEEEDDGGIDGTDAGSEDGGVDVDAGPGIFRMGDDGGFCQSHAECAPLKCRAHVCQ